MCEVQRRDADRIDIGILAAGIFGWNRMGPQIGCGDVNAAQLSNLARRTQHFEFVFLV